MSDTKTVAHQTTPSAPAISSDLAALLVELTQRAEAAFADADELRLEITALREQRAILFQQLHEAHAQIKRQQARIITLIDDQRALRAQVAEWQKAAA